MLRSRANARQRPSESTDERSGSSGYYGGGYPTHVGNSSMAVNQGNSDEYGYNNGGQQQQQQLYHRGGYTQQQQQQQYGHGYEKKGFVTATATHHHHPNAPSVNPFKEKSKSSSSSLCSGMVWYSFLLILLIGLSVDTYSQYRGYRNIVKKLHRVSQHLAGPHLASDYDDADSIDNDASPNEEEETTTNTNEQFESEPQQTARQLQAQLHALSQLQSQLTSTLSEYNSHAIPKLNSEITSLQHQILNIEKENTSRNVELNTIREQKTKLVHDIQSLKNEFNTKHKSDINGKLLVSAGGGPNSNKRVETDQDDINSVEELEAYVEKREGVLWDRIDGLMERLRGQSRVEVVEWFGKGPHKVEFEIEYPQFTPSIDDPAQWPRVRGFILVELAPLHLMPVTINMFLKQVHHKLWNGCAFVINAMHIFQAGPHKYENERYVPNHPDLLGNFKEAKLDKIPFQEYSEQYPHEQYTLGLAGRPGGPDFYINKVNNTKNHGPGGQKIHDLHEEADPCFGKVVKGMDLLDEINKIPIDYTAGNLLKYHVLIVDAKMITEEHNPLEEGREHPVDDDYTKNHVAGGDSVGRVEEEVRDE